MLLVCCEDVFYLRLEEISLFLDIWGWGIFRDSLYGWVKVGIKRIGFLVDIYFLVRYLVFFFIRRVMVILKSLFSKV